MSIILYEPQPNPDLHIVLPDSPRQAENRYRRFFDFEAACRAVFNHVAQLPSDTTPEKHTRNNYGAGLNKFLTFLAQVPERPNTTDKITDEIMEAYIASIIPGCRLPTRELMQAYVALLRARGLKATTIASSYLAPARHFCRALADQPLAFEDHHDSKMLFELSIALPEWRERIRQAASIANPSPETTTRLSPLFDPRFVRLEQAQVNAILRALDLSNLVNLRNYAILHIAFTTALRLAEIQRMSHNSITQEADTWLITVRGKRSNIDPVPTATKAVQDVHDYVNRFNADLPDGDPRRITGDSPLWQPLMKNGAHLAIGSYNPTRGITKEAIRKIISTRSHAALGERYELAAHDTRRTAAYIAFKAGMPIPEIQKLLRHKHPATTFRYIGQEPEYAAANMSTYGINFG